MLAKRQLQRNPYLERPSGDITEGIVQWVYYSGDITVGILEWVYCCAGTTVGKLQWGC